MARGSKRGLGPLLCGLLALAGCAGGEKPEHGGHHHAGGGKGGGMSPTGLNPDILLFLPFDADHDHRITKVELGQAIETTWASIAHGRPTVGLVELRDALAKIYGKSDFDFATLTFDPDGDSKTSQAEFTQALTVKFNIMDTNEDGVLTPDEFYRHAAPGSRPRGERRDEGGPW